MTTEDRAIELLMLALKLQRSHSLGYELTLRAVIAAAQMDAIEAVGLGLQEELTSIGAKFGNARKAK